MRNAAVSLLCLSCFLLVGCSEKPVPDAARNVTPDAVPHATTDVVPEATSEVPPATAPDVRPAQVSVGSGVSEVSDAGLVSDVARAFVIAQEGALSGQNPRPPSPAEMRSAAMPDGYTLGQATVTGDEAQTGLRIQEDEDSPICVVSLNLRRENGRWSVRSTTYRELPHGPPLTMYWKMNPQGEIEFDLEAARAKAKAKPGGQPLVRITNETPAGAFAVKTTQAPPTPVVSVNQFEDFGFAGREDFEKTWQIDINVTDRPLGEVLSELTGPYDVEFRTRRIDEEILERPVSIQLAGVSLLEALDAICAEVDTYPDFIGGTHFSSGGSRVPLLSGQRPGTSGYAGPFLATLESAGRPLAKDTASARITLFALGLPWPGVVAENRDLLQVTEVLDAEGNNLLDTEAYDARKANVRGEARYVLLKADPPLRGVAEGTIIQSLRGKIRAALLAEDYELRFDTYSPGARLPAGPLEIVWQSDGIFEVVGATLEFNSGRMHIECYDADGSHTASSGRGFNRFGNKTHVTNMVEQTPARAVVRVVTKTGLVEYPVEVTRPSQ